MKFRESGMPEEKKWNDFFNPLQILEKMNVTSQTRTLIDIGCGYGTFLLPAAKLVSSKVLGIDIDKEMIDICRDKAYANNILNIDLIQGDISTEETLKELEKYSSEVDYITLFNLLHCEEPLRLLKSAYTLLNANGRIGIIHWKYEETPRGPSMGIRPTPEIITNLANEAGGILEKKIDLPPYHYGLIFVKK
jgi:SAM-dependent methyltransferase